MKLGLLADIHEHTGQQLAGLRERYRLRRKE